ncbi:uncharacterized protein LOC113229362, partial [Hyposmocoma kahamanoa]|uniref:uncharacterized protein LOC113229362 n=1 Tax=Hyposmocoma kahamanoa TaxID=1477025 RepID=UPI000E6DA44A
MILKLIIFITGLSAALSVNFFRKDYTYIEERDAFYKLIWSEEGNSFEEAVNACDNDGSQLFYPKDHSEWRVINNLVKAMPQTPNTTDVLLGIRDEVGNGYYTTLDGHFVTINIQGDALPLDCVILDVNTGELRTTFCEDGIEPRLFVCKKMDSSPCPTVDEGTDNT